MSTDAYMRQIEADLKQIREALALLESAQMHLSAREMSAQESNSPWRNVTQRWIAHQKRMIATYETILAALRKKEEP
jgi:hypothetical protein